jgi:hypothetical protein
MHRCQRGIKKRRTAMKKVTLIGMLAVALAVVLAPQAHALSISHDTLGTLFDDGNGFEGLANTVGGAPDPSLWTVLAGNVPNNVEVLAGGSPGPRAGSKYLKMAPTDPANGNGETNSPSVRVALSSTATSGVITAQWSEYLVDNFSNGGINGKFQFDNSNADAFSSALNSTGWVRGTDPFYGHASSGATVANLYVNDGPGSEFPALIADLSGPLEIPLGQWVDITLVYDLDSDTYTVSTLGQTSQTLGARFTGKNAVGFRFYNQAGVNTGPFYIDAIPEPATLGMLTIGGLMLLRRSRRA